MKHLSSRGISLNTVRLRKYCNADSLFAFAVAAMISGMPHPVTAATLYVNPGGTSGVYSSIGAAVGQAGAGDTIYVAPGTYHEDVIIGKQLSLVGAGFGRSVINAIGLPNGIYVDGIDNPGLSKVVVTGFTVANANFEGVLVTNASYVTFWDNEVIHNDLVLNPSGCPGQPSFETSEGDDCGEGIHLMGVDHSTVANNTSKNNSGGILLSDDTGATHHNLIIANLVEYNAADCGITLASHPAASITGSKSPLGVFRNTVANNDSSHNGTQPPGVGSGIGIFDSVPEAKAYDNVVINNKAKDNGLPGVAMHSHTLDQILNDNVIIGNLISGNGADTADAATPGTTGINVFGVSSITGTVITGNVIDNEAVDIATNTPAQVNAHLNSLLGERIGVDNLDMDGTVDATENWWGSPGGPGTQGATTVNGTGVVFTPWLTRPNPELQR
jgi:parallel beta-helix repeat protein